MKNILIVTGSDYSSGVYEAFFDARKLGYKLFLLSDGSFEPRSGVFEDHFKFDLRKTKEVLAYMKSINIGFDAVTIKTSEWLTPLVALLAKQYGCIGNDPFVAFCCRSKYHMRKRMIEGGIPVPRFKLCKNYEELLEASRAIGLPVVAKPVGGNASYGTFLISNTGDLAQLEDKYKASISYLERKSLDEDVFAFSKEELELFGVQDYVDMVRDYIVEEFMDGPEISVDAMVQNGKVTIMGIEEQIRMVPPYFLQTSARLPYRCSDSEEKGIYDLICKTIEAMGIENSATHTEIIFTTDGPKIVEIACRIGGDDLHDTILKVTGYNLMFESMMIALGIKRNYKVVNKGHTMMHFFFPHQKGTLKSLHVDKELANDPDIYQLDFLAKIGSRVAPPPESFDYLGYMAAFAETPGMLEEKMGRAMEKIKIKIV